MREDEGRTGRTAATLHLVEERGRVSLLKWVNALLRHRVTLVSLPLGLAILVLGWELVEPRTYTSNASFTPAQRSDGGIAQFSGLAAQFGVQLPGSVGNRSPQFYEDLLSSEEVIRMVVESEFSLPDSTQTGEGATEGTLTEVYGIQEPDTLRARAMAMERLRNSLEVRSDLEASVVQLSVRTPHPDLSQQVARHLVEAIHRFNVERRSSQASEERAFLKERVTAVREELRTAEDSLRRFLEQNRSYEGSPRLRFEHDRLQRRVEMQQQVYTSLQQSLEQAKIEEVRTTPVITVVQSPTRPDLADSRLLMLKALAALLLGGILAVAWILGRDAIERGEWEETEHVAEFRHLVDEARNDLERATRRIRRLLGLRGR